MKNLIYLIIILISFTNTSIAQIQTGKDIAVTDTKTGKVRGFISQNGIFTYKGIPYASAKRFEAPQEAKSWEGVRSSMNYGPVAPLMTPTIPPANSTMEELEFLFDHDWGYPGEDCLVLNVWTPAIKTDKKRPVMFWIHGGGYWAGSSQELPAYDGENLAQKGDVVVVSVNHRLNILGFLDLSNFGEKYKYSANNGILDLKVALEWVQANIENFGGDPSNVTIFGQSGGGGKVNNLLAMPSAKGLFHKAINQSGAYRATLEDKAVTQAISTEVLKELNLSATTIDEIQEIPFEQLAAAGRVALKKVGEELKEKGVDLGVIGLNWSPSLDGDLLPYHPISKEALELSKDIPLMIGTTKTEFTLSAFTGMTTKPMEVIRGFIQQQQGEKTDAYIQAAQQAYPNYKLPSDLMDLDLMFRPGAVQQANMKSSIKESAEVFMYLFNWQSPVMNGKFKAMHCIELPFVFDNVDRSESMTGGSRQAHILADKVSQAWINFAKTGNPNHDGLPRWEAYNETNGTTMFFENHCHIRHHHDKAFLELNRQ